MHSRNYIGDCREISTRWGIIHKDRSNAAGLRNCMGLVHFIIVPAKADDYCSLYLLRFKRSKVAKLPAISNKPR